MSKTLFAEEQDPCDMGALLREAVEAHCRASGASQADVARSAGLKPPNLNHALRDPNTRPSTVRAVCRALGLHVELVKNKEGTGTMNQITEKSAKITMAHAVKTVLEQHSGTLPNGRTDVLGHGNILIRIYGEHSRVQLSASEAFKVTHFDAKIGKGGRLGKIKTWTEAT